MFVKMYAYISMRLDVRNTMVLNFFLTLSGQRNLQEKIDIIEKQLFLFDLPENDKMWPKVVKSSIVEFRTSQIFRSSLMRSSDASRGQNS